MLSVGTQTTETITQSVQTVASGDLRSTMIVPQVVPYCVPASLLLHITELRFPLLRMTPNFTLGYHHGHHLNLF